jgi:hypothetical protein
MESIGPFRMDGSSEVTTAIGSSARRDNLIRRQVAGCLDWLLRYVPFARIHSALIANTAAIYTADVAIVLPDGWRLVPQVQSHRSFLIELKRHDVSLFQVQRTGRL